ncbi:major facilitator superfamily domain-containing protein [Dendryphion nanum]|uniref:Major facilitator superfamily domain-containing protein n=1 Tax=Dendryphion nanum TaxID=256645 RepID=A0A9P9IXJ7_9PLEO|nr:major facilitator superfamily domain-containing protein [Dendryphion nanum]
MDQLSQSNSASTTGKKVALHEQEVVVSVPSGPSTSAGAAENRGTDAGEAASASGRKRWSLRRKSNHKKSYSHTHFRVYKRRWFGLAQLVLLNIVVSWDWLTFAPVSTTSAEYFRVSETAINWLSTAFLFSFIAISPVVIWTLNHGPKQSIIWSSILLLLGNWIRYAGTKASGGIYGVVMFGQILTGLSQPFVLAAPTRYSDLWFTESGRISATAVASLANPLGGALAQLINPLLGSIPNMVLYISIIATVACIPSFFIPAAPPTPPSASSTISKTDILTSLKHISRSPSFYVLFATFSVYVGFFNSFSSLLNQILYPYGFKEDEAGICGAILILVGLVAAAIASPIFDRTHAYILGIKILCPLIAFSYLGMVWAPQTYGIEAPYILSAVLGAASFSLLPVSLEYLVEVTFPASPEVGSTICWAGGQLLGGIFIVVMDALKDGSADLKKVSAGGRMKSGGPRPPGNMFNALVFQAVVSLVVLPLPLALGIKKLGLAHEKGRLILDEHRNGREEGVTAEQND